jgi:iron complex outermembrane receptor protein/vitamin B12 transporter
MNRTVVRTLVCAWLIAMTVGARTTAALADEGAIRGTVVDPQGAVVTSASVTLLHGGKGAGTATTDARGEFSFMGLAEGRYQLEVSAPNFEPHTTDPIFVGSSGRIVMQVPLQIGALKQDVVVTASATEVVQSRTGVAVTVIDASALESFGKLDLFEPIRTVPGVSVVQTGARGGTASLFVRGGNSNFNKVLIDGVPANDIGGSFDFSDLATTGVDRVEVMRGSNSVLYGSDAMTGVVSIVTKRGRTARPEFTYSIDGGNFGSLKNDVSVGGAASRVDYFSQYSYFRTDNDQPNNRFKNGVYAGRFGAALATGTDLSVTIRRKDSDYQSPNAILYYAIPDDSFQTSKYTTVGATVQSQLSDRFRAMGRFNTTEQRYHFENPTPTGEPFDPFGFGANYLGKSVTVTGANGTSASGRAILDYGGAYPSVFDSKTNRQGVYGQVDYHASTMLDVSGGVRFEHESGFTEDSADPAITRNNEGLFAEVRAGVSRVQITAGVGYEHNQVFRSNVSPRLSVAAYLRDAAKAGGNDTKVTLNVGKGIKAPSVFQEQSSLFTLVGTRADALGVAPTGAERTKSVDVGIEQGFSKGRGRVRVAYFRNQFDDLIEFVGKSVLPQLGVSVAAANTTSFGAYVNSQSFRAQGLELSADVQASRDLRMAASYTYLDAEVLKSLSGGVLSPAINPAFPNTPIGQYSPLVGSRPFRRPQNIGNLSATYSKGRAEVGASGYFAGKSDDSTSLSDGFFGYSLLLPNKDLVAGYAKVDVSGSYRIVPMLRWYISVENVLNQAYQPSPGFPALPAAVRTGITVMLGGDKRP